MTSHPAPLPGPVADRLTLWPVDDGRYGVDAAFQGVSGYERAVEHEEALKWAGVAHRFVQNLDSSWSIRLGPYTAHEAGVAITAFLR